MRVIEATVSEDGVKLAYFCPDCRDLIEVDTTTSRFPKFIAKMEKWRAMIDKCTVHEEAQPHIVLWRLPS